ncbi:MAG: glycosyltransferase family 4 protein [Gammaproteobacteria bacterium]|nr:glycosyltransferase family 4 protein [Gammaproteobacteria bacterium]
MKILILAPHPFYQERGTPIAVDFLCKALSDRGDEVHVLTFHEGTDREHKNVTIYRAQPWFAVNNVKPGFSVKKLLCDVFLFFKFLKMMRREKYDVVHAVEESAFMAFAVCPFYKTPYIFDIDSSMTTQILDKFPVLKPLGGLLRFLESLPVRYAAACVPVCDALANDIRKYKPKRMTILKDVSLISNETHDNVEQLREQLSIKGLMMMYIGNLESYQGIDLLLNSFASLSEKGLGLSLVIIGGSDADIEKYKGKVNKEHIANVHLVGRKPVAHINDYMKQADILVSPRVHGVNTPMKVYSYLDSGVAVLATDLPTHTQVMTDKIAVLAAADTRSFASGIEEIAADEVRRKELAKNAKEYIEKEHSYSAFCKTIDKIYTSLSE